MLVMLAGGSNVVRDAIIFIAGARMSLTLVLLVVFAMLAAKTLTDGTFSNQYRCLRCGAQRPDMHSKWCEERGNE